MIRNLNEQKYQKLNTKGIKFIPFGIPKIDETLNDLESGTVTLLTGRPGEGKSTLAHQMIVNAVDKGYRTLTVDGEHVQEKLVNKLYKVAIGDSPGAFKTVKYNRKYIKEPTDYSLSKLQKWHKDKIYLYSKRDADLDNYNAIFDLLERTVDALNIDLVTLDNLMSLIDGASDRLNGEQSNFMKRCKRLAENKNCAVVLVAHPNKTAPKGELIDFFQISGSGDLANLADNIILVRRNYDEGGGYVNVLKNRGWGTNIESELYFDEETSCLFETTLSGDYKPLAINWEGKEWQEIAPF